MVGQSFGRVPGIHLRGERRPRRGRSRGGRHGLLRLWLRRIVAVGHRSSRMVWHLERGDVREAGEVNVSEIIKKTEEDCTGMILGY